MNSPLPLLALLFCSFLASCASPGGGSGTASAGRSEFGDRPGPRGFRTVILDAGHGGHDSGAVSPYTMQKEKDAAMDTVRRVREELGGDFKVVLLREGDYFVDLDERVRQANGRPDAVLVSVHYNSGGGRSIRGTETYYWRTDSYSLARRIQSAVSSAVPGQGNRGLVRRRIRLTRNPQIPCVLVECGYLDNPSESRLIADASHRQRLAHAIAGAIRSTSNLGDAGLGPLPRPVYAAMSRPTDTPE